jgi:hypothetical protein
MADHDQVPERRESRAAIRARRAQQREQWERFQERDLETGALDHGAVITEAFAAAFGALLYAAADLPSSERTSHFRAALTRIRDAASSGAAKDEVLALVETSRDASSEHPWRPFHLAALRLAEALLAKESA